jgi:hypothetical protein
VSTFSLQQALLKIDGDLPDGFNASDGIRSLFPSGSETRLSQLQHYLFRAEITLVTSQLHCAAVVKATGSGKWSLSGTVTSAHSTDLIPLHYVVGFAFKSSSGGIARGNFASGEVPIHTGTISRGFSKTGRDDWIVRHWPDAFVAGISGHMIVSQDVGEFIRQLQIVVGVGTLIVLTGGTVVIHF